MNRPKIKLNRESFALVSVLIVALSIFLMVVLLGTKQGLRKEAEIGAPAVASEGYPNFFNTTSYDSETGAANPATVANSAGNTQNIQAPTISGFSSDLFTGGATISYSLDLPPGRGGLTPSLSLNYSSNSVYDSVIGRDVNGDRVDDKYVHNMDDMHGHLYTSDHGDSWYDQLIVQSSQIGLGWDISGLGFIFRDSTDRYTLALNGQSYRLFKDVDNEGKWVAPKNSWHTDPTSFLKIEHRIDELINDEPDKGGDIPENFEVTDSNGTIYTFEPRGYYWKRCDYRDNGCQIDDTREKWVASYNKWVLTKVKDVQSNEISNEISIDYDQENQELTFNPNGVEHESYPRSIYPREIKYSGSGGNFDAKVEFVFKDREDWKNQRWGPLDVYEPYGDPDPDANQTFFSTKRMEGIYIKIRKDGNWETVRQYELDNDQYFESVRDTEGATQGSPCASASDDGFCLLHPKLTKITAKGRDVNTFLPPYTFDYYDISDTNCDDGYCDFDPDAVGDNDRESSSVAGYNNFRLLHLANNGYGGKVVYNYQGYGVMDYDPKTGDWVTQGSVVGLHRVTKKTAYDGQDNFFETTYDYPGSTVGISDDERHSGFESVGHNLVTETVFTKNSASEKIRESKYYFHQGLSDGAKFYVWPERGRLWKTEVFDKDGNLLSSVETDYLREPQDTVWNTAHFIATKETRSCQDANSSSPLGNKATYYYRSEDQNGQQWGNLTQTIGYLVPDCNFGGATAYRMTHNTYFPNLTSHITNRVGGTEILACNYIDPETGQSVAGTVGVNLDEDSDAECPTPKRLSLTWNFYDNAERPWYSPGIKGELTSSRVWYDFPEVVGASEFQSGKWQVLDTQKEYDQFGNLTAVSSFSDYGGVSASNGEWSFAGLGGGSLARTSTTTYEKTYNTFPVKTTILAGDPLERSTSIECQNDSATVNHPYLADRILTTDVNGNVWTTAVDEFGRTKETFVPEETFVPGESVAQTMIDYNDVSPTAEVNPFIVHTQTRDDKGDDSGVTYQHAWQFYNGLGQVIESQAEYANDGVKVGEVPGITLTATEYNALGQAVKTLMPYNPDSKGGVYVAHNWNDPSSLPLHSQAIYDSVGRITKSRVPSKVWSSGQLDNPDSWYDTQTGYYGRKTAVLDPKGHLATTEVDNLGRTISARVFEGPQSLGTPDNPYTEIRSEYDHLDRVKKTTTTDSTGTVSAVSKVSYNRFGQKEWSEDPDLGHWDYTYYPTGTLKTVTDAKHKVTTFVYDELDRVIHKKYDGMVKAVASFGYDYCLTGNGKGRLCDDWSYDPSSYQPGEDIIGVTTQYLYNIKGQLVGENKTISTYIEGQTTPSVADYSTRFTYDAAGRQREITYPDGEKVAYTYNEAGLLNNVANDPSVASAQTYLSSAKYNALGQPEEQVLGNETRNVYDYENNTNRLKSLVLKDKNGDDLWFQNPFVYDKVGNILNITSPDSADPLQNITYTYSYDDLSRLVGMTPSQGEVGAAYKYDQLGRMTLKQEGEGESLSPECVSGKENPNLPGDLDCDCRVTMSDIMKVTAIWNTNQGDERFNPDFDFDGDGRISSDDITYVSSRWRNHYP